MRKASSYAVKFLAVLWRLKAGDRLSILVRSMAWFLQISGFMIFRRQNGETFFKPVAYTASKSALLGFTRYLSTYWGEANVRVNLMTLAGVFNHQDDALFGCLLPESSIGAHG